MMRMVPMMKAEASPVRMLFTHAEALLLLCFRNQRSGMRVPNAKVMRTAAMYATHGIVISVKWKMYMFALSSVSSGAEFIRLLYSYRCFSYFLL